MSIRHIIVFFFFHIPHDITYCQLFSGDVTALQAALSTLEAHPAVATSNVLHLVLYSSLSYISKQAQHAAWFTASTYPLLHQVLNAVQGQQAELVTKAQQSLLVSADGAKASNNDSATSGASALPPVTPAELDSSIDWAAAGLVRGIKSFFYAFGRLLISIPSVSWRSCRCRH